MPIRILSLLVLFLSVIRLSAQQKGEFVSNKFVSENNDTLPYQFYISAGIDTTKNYPLILWLHGKGERGKDNKMQLTLIKNWLPDSLDKSFPGFILAPQCSVNETWSKYDKLASQITFDTVTPEIQKSIISLLDELGKTYPIDTSRIYIMGISMGGFGVFDIITRYPNRFAAAISICGGGDPEMHEHLNKTPIWAFHGENDKVVDKRHSIQVMNEILNEEHFLTLYPGVGHDCWNKVFKEKGLIKWMYFK